MMDDFGVMRSPREILFGAGQRHALGGLVARRGSRALVVTDARLAADPQFNQMIADLEHQGVTVRINASCQPDVPAETAVAAADAARGYAPDIVVGVGGGSCLDMAKCLSLLLAHGGRPADYYGELKVPGPVVPLVAVPTTAGTGSEVTPVAVLSDSERSLKVGISSPYLIPDLALCDPELTLTCPPGLTAIAGADAMTHAIEAFTASRSEANPALVRDRVFVGKNILSDHFALAAIELLWSGLAAACADGGDLAARSRVMRGATLAGLAFGVAGTAAAHAIQYPVGALTHTPHGAGVACLMPYVMAYNRPKIEPELDAIAQVIGVASGAEVIDAVAGLFQRIGLPRSLRDLGLPEDRLDWVAEQSCGIERLLRNNPRPLDRPSMNRLVHAAFVGDTAGLS